MKREDEDGAAAKRDSPAPSGAAAPPPHDVPDLLHGGLLYRLMSRFGVDPEQAARAARRGALTGFVLWAPMAIAAFVEGHALPGNTKVPFLFDVAAYVRPLVVIPVLLVSEAVLAAAWRLAGQRFRDRGLVGPECRDAYEALVDRVTRTVRRTIPEILCLAVAAFLVYRLVGFVVSAPRDMWFAQSDGPASSRLTVAGMWHGFVVHTVLFYLVVRWLWLLSLWYRFLFGVSRLPLHLHPAHPDRAAGLGFIGRTVSACAPLTFAFSASLAATVANHMIHRQEHLSSFAPVGIVVLGAILVIFVLPPALIFLPLLVRTRRLALEDWSRRMAFVADAHTGGASTPPVDPAAAEDALGLEDLSIAVAAVRAMLPVPIGLSHVVGPVAAAGVPVLALLFLAFPAREILDKALSLVF